MEPKLYRTSTVDSHWHVVYAMAEDSACSKDKGHSHRVVMDVIDPEMLDAQTGMPVTDREYAPPVLMEEDGHTHDLESEIEMGGPKKGGEDSEEEDTDALDTFWQQYKEVVDYEAKSFENAQEAESVYCSEGIWPEEVKSKLSAEDRAALNINEIEPKMDLLSGYQRRNRTDIRYLPVEGGDSKAADMLNILVKQISYNSGLVQEETAVFDDEIIAGRGAFNIVIDNTSEDSLPEGEIKVERMPWHRVRFGPSEKVDFSDCEVVFREQWYSARKLDNMFPDHEGEFSGLLASPASQTGAVSNVVPPPGFRYEGAGGKTETFSSIVTSMNVVDSTKKSVLLIERELIEYERFFIIANTEDDYFLSLENVDDANSIQKKVKTMGDEFTVHPRTRRRIRITTCAGTIRVQDYYAERALNELYTIPVYAKRRTRKDGTIVWYGKVLPAIDVCREMSKRRSQIVDILNRVAGYGWFYDAETFGGNKTDERHFKENAGKAGFIQKVSSLNNRPVKDEGTRFPSEIANMLEVDERRLSFILNIFPESVGTSDATESGVAIVQKQKAGLMGNEFLFDQLSMAKRKIGKIIAAEIQRIYTAERIWRIIQTAQSQSLMRGQETEQPMIGEKPAVEYTIEEIQAMLDNADLTRYDVVVDESPWSPTMRRATLADWMAYAQHGGQVPPEFLLDLSDLPKSQRDEVKARIQQIQQSQMDLENRKIDSEVQKTAIASAARTSGSSAAAQPQQ